jgi:hypothetical protein
MANKKISEFPVTTSLAGNDAFLINHLGSTSTVAFSSVSNTISQTITNSLTGDTVIQKLSGNFIKKPDTATAGQVLTYNGSTSTWVASALPSFTGTNQSPTSNGYQKLPGGLIIQWGVTDSINGGANVQKTVTFPIPFPNSCFNVTSTLSGNLYGQTDALSTLRVQVIAIIDITNNSVILEHTGINAVRAYWMAIGN